MVREVCLTEKEISKQFTASMADVTFSLIFIGRVVAMSLHLTHRCRTKIVGFLLHETVLQREVHETARGEKMV